MLLIGRLLFGNILRAFRSRSSLLLENLVLRQQLAVLKRKHPRPQIAVVDKLFWVLTRRVWLGWKQALTVVTPDTVVRWHREGGWSLYWRAISKAPGVMGRKRISKEARDLIFRMVDENPTWGSPRIHGELLMLGFDVSETTISRWMRPAPRNPEPAKRWLAFLHNHREAIAAMDFFTVPTMTFSLLYCFFVIGQRPKLSEWKYQLRSFIVRQDFGQRQRIAANLSAQLKKHGIKFVLCFGRATQKFCLLDLYESSGNPRANRPRAFQTYRHAEAASRFGCSWRLQQEWPVAA